MRAMLTTDCCSLVHLFSQNLTIFHSVYRRMTWVRMLNPPGILDYIDRNYRYQSGTTKIQLVGLHPTHILTGNRPSAELTMIGRVYVMPGQIYVNIQSNHFCLLISLEIAISRCNWEKSFLLVRTWIYACTFTCG